MQTWWALETFIKTFNKSYKMAIMICVQFAIVPFPTLIPIKSSFIAEHHT